MKFYRNMMLKRKIIHAISYVLKNYISLLWGKTTFELLNIFPQIAVVRLSVLTYNLGFSL